MSTCNRCGETLPAGVKKCPTCGYDVGWKPGGLAYQEVPRKENKEEGYHSSYTDETFEYEIFDGENDQTRRISALCYVGPVFFVPLLLKKDSDYIRFHTNQGLVLFLCELAAFGIFHGLIGLAMKAGCIYCAVQGIKNANVGKKERLPYIGKVDILKFNKKK